MRKGLILLGLLWCVTMPAMAGLNIGINVSFFPQLVAVPGYPVYYAPDLESNYFFYDGAYWVYQNDNWYSSSWYNGPWDLMDPDYVPLYVLRIPVQYYRRPPQYFGGWQREAPPHWGEHWGNSWSQRRGGWDQWDRHAAPAPAPLPVYQRQYTGNRYPAASQQQELQSKNYDYRGHTERGRPQPERQQQAPQRQQPQPERQQQAPQRQRPQPERQQQAPQRQQSQPERQQQAPKPEPRQGRDQGQHQDRQQGDKREDNART